jgi:phosphoenolpyruvate synthase/pyruvate phosphate dikinase
MNDSTPEIIWVDDLDDSGIPMVGSKMARLGQLKKWGLRVPRGFGLTSKAYQRFLEEADLNDLIDEEMDALDESSDTAAIAEASRRIRKLVESARVPEDLRDIFKHAYGELCYQCFNVNQPVAVRSSAIGEDAADASFAGQFDTYLGLTGREDVLLGVKRCWGSLFTERGITYRLKNHLGHRESPMAVCVLELIDARASGVAFSIDPVTGKRDRIVIEGNWGWGEAVVQGVVTPDHVTVEKEELRMLDYKVNVKHVVSAFDYNKGEVVEKEMPDRLKEEKVLTDDQVNCIARAVKCIEDNYDKPMDVEWVIPRSYREGDDATIVQTRPETVHSENEEDEELAWDPVAMANKYAFGKSE